MSTIKLVAVGNSWVGKTSLLYTYFAGMFPLENKPIVFDISALHVEVDGQQCLLTPWDTAGQDDYDRLRPLVYPQTDVLLVCFSLVQPDSFNNVEIKWYPELKCHCPDVPIILVGTKLDLRNDKEHVELMNRRPVSMEEGITMQRKNSNVVQYMECSAWNDYGVNEVFEEAARVALKYKQRIRAQQRCVLL